VYFRHVDGAMPAGGECETMAVFMVERRYAQQLEDITEVAADINRVNDEVGVRWLSSFLSADKRKTFCLYESPDVESIRRAAERAGLTADVIVELEGEVAPDGSLSPL
jgi:hypothetical protein